MSTNNDSTNSHRNNNRHSVEVPFQPAPSLSDAAAETSTNDNSSNLQLNNNPHSVEVPSQPAL